jgi:hypothetical protein
MKERLDEGRRLGIDTLREKRDVAFYAKRVLIELGADELAQILGPLHRGPLKDIRRGHGGLVRVALRSALRHFGVPEEESR